MNLRCARGEGGGRTALSDPRKVPRVRKAPRRSEGDGRLRVVKDEPEYEHIWKPRATEAEMSAKEAHFLLPTGTEPIRG